MTQAKPKMASISSCCGTVRRRTIVSKLVTIGMQIAVIVVVWFVVKHTVQTQDCNQDNPTVEVREESPIEPLCEIKKDFKKGARLQFADFAADPTNAIQIQDNSKVLTVDIFVRDNDTGITTLYPKGTYLVMGSDTASYQVKHSDQDSFDEKINFDAKDESKLDDHDIKNTNIGNIDPDSISRDGIPGNNDGYNEINNFLAGSNSIRTSNNQMVAGNNEMKMNNPGLEMNNQNNGQSLNHAGSLFGTESQSADVIGMSAGSAHLQEKDFDHQLSADMNKDNQGMIPGHQLKAGDLTGTLPPGENADYNSDTPGGDPEELYTSGFQERIEMFKSEFYGNSLENGSPHSVMNYLMNNPDVCSDSNVELLFLVHSDPGNQELRSRIRSTFVQRELFQPFSLRHVFLVGKTTSPNFQANLASDAEKYGDIVQGDFEDKPGANTLKGLLGMKWTLSFCPRAKYVMKINGDVFVDTDKLMKAFIPSISRVIGKRAMLCSFSVDTPIPRSGPNAVSPNLFPNSSKMRPYCRGFAVLMTPAAISSLLAASTHVPFCPLDDMFLYGVLPFIAGGIEIYDVGNKRAFHDFGMEVVKCYQDLRDRCQFVVTKAFSSRFTSLWELVKARRDSGSDVSNMGQSLWDIGSWRINI